MGNAEINEIKHLLRKLDKLDRELENLKRNAGNIRHRDLAKIARKMGMERSKTRNTEPYFESELLPDTSPIPIPDHSGTLGKGLSIRIIKQLQDHLFLLREDLLDKEGRINKQRNELGNVFNYEKYEN